MKHKKGENEERICFGVSTLICGEIMLFKVKAHGSITERQCPEIYVFVYYCSYALKTRKKWIKKITMLSMQRNQGREGEK